MAVLCVAAWFSGDFVWGDMFGPRRRANMARFFQDIVPRPVREEGDWGAFWPWFAEIWSGPGSEAVLHTVLISICGAVLALVLAMLVMPLLARGIAVAEPFVSDCRERPPGRLRRGIWTGIRGSARATMILVRSMPEYVIAFLLIGLIGPTAWPAVLALALHNWGILGRLGSEVVENTARGLPAAQRAIGARRSQIVLFGVMPVVLPRVLVYFFYRWETCVRDATVLGLLGISSLGFYFQDARARGRYDEMLLFVVLGMVVVFVGDFVSHQVRKRVR